jgi:hypothetical protein
MHHIDVGQFEPSGYSPVFAEFAGFSLEFAPAGDPAFATGTGKSSDCSILIFLSDFLLIIYNMCECRFDL